MSMNPSARHLTLEEREIIAQSLAEGMNFKEIGTFIRRHPSAASRGPGSSTATRASPTRKAESRKTMN